MPGAARAKPRIRVAPGELHRASKRAEQLLAADGAFFHAGGPITRIVEKAGGAVVSEQVNEHTLSAVLSSKCDWERRRGNEWVRCDPPGEVVRSVMSRQDREHLQMITGLARQPFFAPDRTLVTASGYNAGTGIYGAFESRDYSLDELTRDQAETALQYLKWLIKEFPFESKEDRSAALGAMLTAAIRPSLPQAPAFNITATRPGSGKSYLAKLIALVAGPGEPHSTSYPSTAEEAAKMVLAMLLEKPATILFDDMQTNWKSFGALNRALTSPTTTERLLRSNRTATANTNVLFLGTGNNVRPERDMRRRVVSIRLAPEDETPALRSYRSEKPLDHLRKHRTAVVKAALTIIGAYQAAGEVTEAPALEAFDVWGALCRQPLLWLGERDPATSLVRQLAEESQEDGFGDFLDAWHQCFRSDSVTVRKVVDRAEHDQALGDALAELPVMDGRHVNPGKLGWYLRNNCGRRANRLELEVGDLKERKSWKVVSHRPAH